MKYAKRVMMGLLAMGLCITACQNNSKNPTKASGDIYTLETVNGNKVPYNPVPKGSAPQVQSGTFTLNTNRAVIHATNFGQVDGKELSHDSKRHLHIGRHSPEFPVE